MEQVNSAKKIRVPFIEGLENKDFSELELSLELNGAKGSINEVNWPAEFPYTPDCNFAIGRSETHLAVLFHVRGLDLRAAAMEDNGHVWEDSCCELFISDPEDGTYYNFELNCIGTLLSAKGEGRHERVYRSPEILSKVKRHTTVRRQEWNENGKIFDWSVAMVIPFELMGVDPGHLPQTMKANFYKCADKAEHIHFLSWNPIDCPSPDFHRPEFFGTLEF